MSEAKRDQVMSEAKLKDLQPSAHVCLFCDDSAEQLGSLLAYTIEGLTRGECCVCMMVSDVADEIQTALLAAHVDVPRMRERGALLFPSPRDYLSDYLSMGEFSPQAMIGFLRRTREEALGRGFTRLRVVGEMSWTLAAGVGARQLVEFEALLNDFCAETQSFVLCLYQRQRFTPAVMRQMLRTHPLVSFDGQTCANFYYEPPALVLSEEAEDGRVEWMTSQLRQARAAGNELRRREQDFRALAEHSPDVIARFDQELRHVYVNPAVEAATGFPAQYFMGKTHSEMGMPEDLVAFWQGHLRRVFSTGEPLTIEFSFPTHGGTRHYQSRLVPEFAADGTVETVLSVARDITERKRAEEGLSLYRQVIANSSEGIAIIDPQGYYVEQNAAHEALIGYSDEELHGKTPAIHFGEEAFRAVGQELARIGRFRGELVSRTKSGKLVDIDLSAFAVRDVAGHPICYVGIKRDITERKQIEEQLRARERQQAAVARLGQLALKGVDLAELMDEAVDVVARTLGVEYAKVLELLPDNTALRLRAGVGWKAGLVGTATVGAGTDSQAGYTLLSTEPVIVDDLRIETRFSGPPLLHDHGVVSGMSVIIAGRERPFGVLGTHTTRRRAFTHDDVNFLQAVANILAMGIERKRTEAEREQLRTEAERRAEQLTSFVHMVAHDVRQPLTAARGQAQLLMRALDRADQQRARANAEALDTATRRLDTMIQDLVDIVRLEVGQFRLERERLELTGFVSDLLRRLVAALDVERVTVDARRRVEVDADPNRLERIIGNLISNALKYSDRQTPVIVRIGTQGGDAVISIVDRGIGIAQDEIPRIFERGFRSERAVRRAEGLGLGLHITKELVEAHGGRLEVVSVPGQGSTFTLTLPLANHPTA